MNKVLLLLLPWLSSALAQPLEPAPLPAELSRGLAQCGPNRPQACVDAGRILLEGALVSPDPVKAQVLLDGSCLKGQSEACALLVHHGLGTVEQRTTWAVAGLAGFEKRCRAGSAVACLSAGELKASISLPDGLPLFERACDAGIARGCERAAEAVDAAQSVHFLERATRLHQGACLGGQAASCAWLARSQSEEISMALWLLAVERALGPCQDSGRDCPLVLEAAKRLTQLPWVGDASYERLQRQIYLAERARCEGGEARACELALKLGKSLIGPEELASLGERACAQGYQLACGVSWHDATPASPEDGEPAALLARGRTRLPQAKTFAERRLALQDFLALLWAGDEWPAAELARHLGLRRPSPKACGLWPTPTGRLGQFSSYLQLAEVLAVIVPSIKDAKTEDEARRALCPHCQPNEASAVILKAKDRVIALVIEVEATPIAAAPLSPAIESEGEEPPEELEEPEPLWQVDGLWVTWVGEGRVEDGCAAELSMDISTTEHFVDAALAVRPPMVIGQDEAGESCELGHKGCTPSCGTEGPSSTRVTFGRGEHLGIKWIRLADEEPEELRERREGQVAVPGCLPVELP